MSQLIEWLMQWVKQLALWVTVAPWEQGVRVRLGRWAHRLDPGLHYLIPIVDAVYVHNVKRRSVTLQMQTVTSADGKTYSLGGAVSYYIDDLLAVYQTTVNVEDLVVQYAQAEVAEYVWSQVHGKIDATAMSGVVSGLLQERFASMGLSQVELFVTDIVSVKTYRVISDTRWSTGGSLRLGEHRG
jgi:hypothetical protein